MTKFVKRHWDASGEALHLSMPLSKVDKENRLVHGFATLDNVDSQGDVVEATASMNAFARARGNIREQHDENKAVGKLMDYREDSFYDKESDKWYQGVFVTAYVSKGAEDTWQKVLDGTLSGFSIGGSINKFSNEINKESGSQYRLIKDYDLTELSLVDNPANQLANVFSVQKSANGSVTVEGMAAETTIENVFYCETDGLAQAKSDDSADCLECGETMKNIGWFEVVDDKMGKVKDIVNDFVKSNNGPDEGGVTMAKKEEEKVEKSEETENEEVTEVEDDEPVEKEEVSEVEDDEERISKKIDELNGVVHQTLEANREETSTAIKALENKIDEINKAFNDKATELESSLNGLNEKLDTAKSRLAGFEKSLDALNKSVAVRKSSDVESEHETVTKSKWNGAFSIDNLH